jgi:hypothetical protein
LKAGPEGGWRSGDVIAFKKGDTWDLSDTRNQDGTVVEITLTLHKSSEINS